MRALMLTLVLLVAGCASSIVTPSVAPVEVAPTATQGRPAPPSDQATTASLIGHDDVALEGRLPDRVRAWDLRKSSTSFEHLLTAASKLAGLVRAVADILHVSPTTVTVAVATPSGDMRTFGGIQVHRDPGATEDLIVAALGMSPLTVGGVTVYDAGTAGDPPMHTYAYVSGDALYMVYANDNAVLEAAVQELTKP